MIDNERLAYVPEQHRMKHWFCFWIHDLMVEGMRQAEVARASHVSFKFRDEDDKKNFEAAPDPITYALENNRLDLARRIALNQSVIPLYGDALHFIYEGMRTLEKHKHTVSIALFRKPLRQNLLFLTWMFADERDYFARFHADASRLDENLAPERIKELITAACDKFRIKFDADLIYDMVFNKRNQSGLGHYFDKALHLVTSQAAVKTEDLNLNMIFANPSDDGLYDGIYHVLAYPFMYLLFLQVEMLRQMTSVPEFYSQWLDTATWTAYEAIFGCSTEVVDAISERLGDLLTCSLCRKPLRITPENALEFFADEIIHCTHCTTRQQFPLYWLMSRMADETSSLDVVNK